MTDAEFLERCGLLCGKAGVPKWASPRLDFFTTTYYTAVQACLWREHLRGWLTHGDFSITWMSDDGVLVSGSRTGDEVFEESNENAALIAAVEAVMAKEQGDE